MKSYFLYKQKILNNFFNYLIKQDLKVSNFFFFLILVNGLVVICISLMVMKLYLKAKEQRGYWEIQKWKKVATVLQFV